MRPPPFYNGSIRTAPHGWDLERTGRDTRSASGECCVALKCHLMKTPVGMIELEASEDGLCGLWFLDRAPARPVPVSRAKGEGAEHLRAAAAQLAEYFKGDRSDFELMLDLRGSDFDCLVWQLLLRIPYGRTRTYGQLAREMGSLTLARAVGGACGRNPISVIVPCHRVIGSDSDLTGYGGGLGRKEKLLRLEGAHFGSPQMDLF